MPLERWGSLSVNDHVDTRALVANVLLYDRLVVPVMTEQIDRDERAYWKSRGWDPDLQLARLDTLEDLAVRRPWDAVRREAFRSRKRELEAEQRDTAWIDAGTITREILAQEQVVDIPAGNPGVRVVAAYNSTAAVQHDFPVVNAADHLSAQAYLLSRRLATPDLKDPEDSLREAIKLSRAPDFRDRRSELYDFQGLAVARGWTPSETVERMSEMTDKYNDIVKSATNKVRWRFAFTVCLIGVGFATAGPVGAAASAAVSLLQFAVLDRKPTIDAGSTEPVVMFHDIQTRLGIGLQAAP
ncbi:MAG TPA: hypothetical protein VF068_14415 [Rubrobacter sp.]